MTAADPDDPDHPDDDPLIKSMRSVWLGMRDEDPPERGLAELMAAARTQAASMKPEPWWRRSLAFLMRPPVLAAAAVVVVIGGAVVLKGRGGGNDAAMPTIESGLKEQQDQKDEKARTLEAERDGVRDLTSKTEVTTAPPAAEPIGRNEAAGAGSAAPVKVARPPEKPVAPAAHDDRSKWGNVKQDNGQGNAVPPPPPPPPPTPDPGAESGLLIAGEGKDVKDVNDVKTDKKPPVAKVPAGQRPAPQADQDAPSIDATGTKDGRTVTVSTEQLVKQAETAANRNDCPAVRATVARIKKASPETYKSKVITQPAIARCLK